MSNALTTTNDMQMMPSTDEWSLMRDMAAQLVPTRFLPESIKTPEQAVAIMLKGRELRVPPMYALSNIAVVKGKPTVSAEMMLALIYRDHGKQAIRVKQSTNESCTVEYRTEGWEGTSEYTFSIEDARKAGLNGGVWNAYPAAMLRARCISAVARMAFPESIAGMYVPGELGDDVTVSTDGEVGPGGQWLLYGGSDTDGLDTERPSLMDATITPPSPRLAHTLRHLQDVAIKRGITPDMLHEHARELGHETLSRVPESNLAAMAKRIAQLDDASLGAEWARFGWTAPAHVDTETGEILDAQYTETTGPDLKTVKDNLWKTVHGVWNWSLADLDAVSRRTYDRPAKELTAEEVEKLHHELLLLNEEQRTAELNDALAAVA